MSCQDDRAEELTVIWRRPLSRKILPAAIFAVLTQFLPIGAAGAAEGSVAAWRSDYVGRLEALALLQSLNVELLSHDSATLTLDRWCEAHRLASPARIVAERINDNKSPSDEVRRQLDVGPSEEVQYRHVPLRCGSHVLSEADNWYVPARLTVEMNRVLNTTDTAFGRAVQGLKFRRHTISADLLWYPLPKGWEYGSEALHFRNDMPLVPPEHVIEHRAVLTLPDGTPFSEVVEIYSGEILDFPEPPRP